MSAAAAAMPRIRIRGLCKRFGAHAVLQGVDLDVMPGTSMVVVGASGSGKSVLLKCLLGLVEPDAGRIEIDGAALPAPARRARMGMLFQNAALFDSLPVWENVAFAPIARGLPRAQARARAVALLQQVGLDAGVADLWPAALSGGMQKRVGLARAVAARPDMLLFDEPTTGLDPVMGAVIDELIIQSVRNLGGTAIAITHDMASAMRIGDRAAMLHEGRIVWRGEASRLLDSGDPVVDRFTHGRRA